jgi:hypothetical protein
MKTILVVLALATITSTVRAANGVTLGQFVIEPATSRSPHGEAAR